MSQPETAIEMSIKLSRELLSCADAGDLERDDDSCGVFFGIVRDSAYKIILEAERERQRHIQRGVWEPV